jgi:predicted GNAT family acetyltransferase
MQVHPLDNPVWSSLSTRQAALAVMLGKAGRYAAQVAPFAAVSSPEPEASVELETLINGGESVYFVGISPDLGRGWTVEPHGTIPQLLCDTPAIVRAGPDPVTLTEAQRSDMLGLTALVFPGFFRSRTIEMGHYYGIYHGRVLAAMAGERMHLDGYQEISAVCTHPEFIGRGYAQRLVALVTNSILERGITPFLHVHKNNTRALSLYEHLGFRTRTEVGLWHVTRDRQL